MSPSPATSSQSRFRLRWIPSGAAVVVIGLVVAIDALALASILTARREAQAAAVAELSRQTASQAKAIEALLATLRADLAFLAASPQLGAAPERLTAPDPLSRRWARLEAEGTLLLFAGGHPPIVSLELDDGQQQPLAVVARLVAGEPAREPAVVAQAPPNPQGALLLEVPVEGGGRLRAVVDPALLLASVSPELAGPDEHPDPAEGLSLGPPTAHTDASGRGHLDDSSIEAIIDTRGWQPETPLALHRHRQGGLLLTAVERLGSRWRWTVLLNLLVISLGLPLAFIAVRAARRAAALAAEEEHAEQKRQLERGMWRQERLATVGRMASGIAHEINNPLAGMNNHLSMLDEELAAGDLDAARRRAPKVRHGLERIRGIVQRALRLANPGSGTRQPVDLAELAEQTIDLLGGTEIDRRVILSVQTTSPAGHVVEGERAVLGQLLTNLILNALDWGAGRPVEVRLLQEAEKCVIVVADRGPGIDPAIADRLFEPFVSSRGSTGLGLAVSLGIAREHGGTIIAENRDGGGARFVVRLPRAISPSAATTHNAPTPASRPS